MDDLSTHDSADGGLWSVRAKDGVVDLTIVRRLGVPETPRELHFALSREDARTLSKIFAAAADEAR